MLKIYLMRHGSTEWNEAGRFRGLADMNLSTTGFSQARAVGEALSNVHFDRVLVSPLKRALQTRETVMSCNCCPNTPYDVDQRLQSLYYGAWEGKLESEVAAEWPELWEEFTGDGIATVQFPSGERGPGSNMTECYEACASVVRHCEQLWKESGKEDYTILLVTHQNITRTMLSHLFGVGSAAGYWRIGCDCACVNMIEKKEQDKGLFVVKKINMIFYE